MILTAPLKEHARLGASSSHRWMACPGTIRASQGLQGIATDYQREGTAAHRLLEGALVEAVMKRDWEGWLATIEAVNVQDPDESWVMWDVDDEMIAGVSLTVETVIGRARMLRENAEEPYLVSVETERTFDLAPLNPPEPMFGTTDAVVAAPRSIELFDLKYGRGVVVEVLDNSQLRTYVVGAIVDAGMKASPEVWEQVDNHRLSHTKDGVTTALDVGLSLFDSIAITIIQPRAPHIHGPVRTEYLTPAQVREFARDLLAAARKTQEDDAPFIPGEHCKFCPAKGFCPALAKRAQAIAAAAFDAEPVQEMPAVMTKTVERLSIEEIAKTMSALPIVEEWIRAVKQRVLAELNRGVRVPGWKLVAKRGKRHWVNADQAAHDLIAMGLDALDVYEPAVMKSPAQIEKLIGRGRLPKEMAVLVSNGATTAPEHDPRAALGADAAALLPPVVDGPNAQSSEE